MIVLQQNLKENEMVQQEEPKNAENQVKKLAYILHINKKKKVGVSAIMYGAIGIFGGIFDKNFSKDSRITIMLISMGTTLICEIIAYIYKIINGASIEVLTFLKIVLIEIIFNLMIIIIIYPLIRKLGEKLEQVFNEDKILTKYF